jgi:hypothetical protein
MFLWVVGLYSLFVVMNSICEDQLALIMEDWVQPLVLRYSWSVHYE